MGKAVNHPSHLGCIRRMMNQNIAKVISWKCFRSEWRMLTTSSLEHKPATTLSSKTSPRMKNVTPAMFWAMAGRVYSPLFQSRARRRIFSRTMNDWLTVWPAKRPECPGDEPETVPLFLAVSKHSNVLVAVLEWSIGTAQLTLRELCLYSIYIYKR